jgi:hypothetical protein
MAKYMGFVKMAEGIAPPPQALMDAMDVFVGKSIANGNFLDGGGLYGSEDSVNFVIRSGELTQVDGPYAEAKEIVGGWAIMEFESTEAAIENSREMAQLHVDHWPTQDLVITLRQISEEPPAGV